MTRIAIDMSGRVALVTGGGYGMGRLERAPVVGAVYLDPGTVDISTAGPGPGS